MVLLWLTLLTAAVMPLALQRGCAILSFQPPTRDVDDRAIRGLWVTRWDYRTAADVRKVMRDAADLGFTDVFWQVRGQADAYYRSDLEPWGELIAPPGAGPGFDPLALAVREAHARGLRIHAWANVMPLWRGTMPPRDGDHAFYAHPDWRLTSTTGEPQALHDGYVIVNPVREDVHEHIAAVFADIVRRYDVDGIHMDYVRFVPDGLGEGVYPGDPASIDLFRRQTGRAGVSTPADRAAYRAWVRGRITDLVARIRRDIIRVDPGVELSAAVWRRPDIAANDYLQDAGAWLRAGLIDRALPMIYTADDDQFISDLDAWLAASAGNPVSAGIGIYKHEQPEQTAHQILLSAAADGYCLFAYSSIFTSADPNQDERPEAARLRDARRAELDALLHATSDF